MFNAETLIEGFVSGIIGIGVSLLICIPINIVVKNGFDIEHIANLPWQAGVILVLISIGNGVYDKVIVIMPGVAVGSNQDRKSVV